MIWLQIKKPVLICGPSLETSLTQWRQDGTSLPLGQNNSSLIELSLEQMVFLSSLRLSFLSLRRVRTLKNVWGQPCRTQLVEAWSLYGLYSHI